MDEIRDMVEFYNGERCVITRTLNDVVWCHMLDEGVGRVSQSVCFPSVTLKMYWLAGRDAKPQPPPRSISNACWRRTGKSYTAYVLVSSSPQADLFLSQAKLMSNITNT
jgi:hypothetical protein